MGCTPQEFIIRLRLTKAAEMMKTTNASIGDISLHCGYPNQLHFSQAFKKRYARMSSSRNRHRCPTRWSGEASAWSAI